MKQNETNTKEHVDQFVQAFMEQAPDVWKRDDVAKKLTSEVNHQIKSVLDAKQSLDDYFDCVLNRVKLPVIDSRVIVYQIWHRCNHNELSRMVCDNPSRLPHHPEGRLDWIQQAATLYKETLKHKYRLKSMREQRDELLRQEKELKSRIRDSLTFEECAELLGFPKSMMNELKTFFEVAEKIGASDSFRSKTKIEIETKMPISEADQLIQAIPENVLKLFVESIRKDLWENAPVQRIIKDQVRMAYKDVVSKPFLSQPARNVSDKTPGRGV